MRNKSEASSDDISDMNHNTPFSERDTDAVFAGRAVNDPALERVRVALASMKSSLVEEPPTEDVLMFASKLAHVAGTAETPETQKHAASPWRRRLAAAVGVAAVSAFGVAGAAAADEAAPGDALYSVDKALEDVGILDGGTDERLDEAQQLMDEGDTEGALELAGDALEEDGQDDAVTGLRQAALAVASQSSGDDVRAQVASMLEWMSEQDSRGAEFGAGVSERARQISGHANEQANTNANTHGNDKTDADADEVVEPTTSDDAADTSGDNATDNAGDNASDNVGDNASDHAGDNGNSPAAEKPVDRDSAQDHSSEPAAGKP